MRYVLLPLLFPLLLCTCGRDPLSIKEIVLDLPEPTDGLTAVNLPDQGRFTTDAQLLAPHEDLTVKLSYRLGAHAEAALLLQGHHSLSLNDLTLSDLAPSLAGAPPQGGREG